MNINDLIPLFTGLLGFPALVSALVNVLKYFNLVADGQASSVVFWIELAGFVAVAIAYFTGNVPVIGQIDAELGNFATFLLSFLSFITSLGITKLYHVGLRGTPVIGKSYS